MSSLFREMFDSEKVLTEEEPGNAFSRVVGTMYPRVGGPRLEGHSGRSADLRIDRASVFGVYDLPGDVNDCLFVGGWFFLKSLQNHEAILLAMTNRYGDPGPVIAINQMRLMGGVSFRTMSVCPIDPIHCWVYLGIAISKLDDSRVNLRFYYKLKNHSMQSWGEMNGIVLGDEKMTGLLAGCAGSGPEIGVRMGFAAGYQFQATDFSDIEYPVDILEPGGKRIWYCNPATGDDTNDGASPETAWASVEKLNLESRHAGLFSSSDYENGDTLVIDTSSEELDLHGDILRIMTPGLNVRAAAGQTWIKIKAYRTLLSDSWVPVPNSNIYFTQDTEAHIVLWENDKFMHHPMGMTFEDVKNQIDSTPGSFWTDGNSLYMHAFDSTDPRIDGKRYERSYLLENGAPVTLSAVGLNVQDIHVGKTCLAEKASNDALGGYCLANNGRAGRTRIGHCFLYYGSKHNLGLTEGYAGDQIVVDRVQVEQGSPYPTFGGQTVLVSFNAGASNIGIKHIYQNCVCTANAGVIGSTLGTMSLKYPVFYSHNNGGENQFSMLEFSDCDFGSGVLSGDAVNRVEISNCRVGSVLFNADVNISRSLINGTLTNSGGHHLQMRHSIQIVKGTLTDNTFGGRVTATNCVFDVSAVSSFQGGVPQAALFNRVSPIAVVFRNNVVIMPKISLGINLFSQLYSTDSLEFSNNAYSLYGNSIVYQYNNGINSTNQSLLEWQANGYDESSFETIQLLLNDYIPLPESPLIAAGFNLGSDVDFTGDKFHLRDDIGAYQSMPKSFNDWRQRFFSTNGSAGANIQADESFSGDGLSNLVKYALDINPLTSYWRPVYQAGFDNHGRTTLSYLRRNDLSDVDVKFEESNNLTDWMDVPIELEQVVSWNSHLEKVQVTLSNDIRVRRFIRLKTVMR